MRLQEPRHRDNCLCGGRAERGHTLVFEMHIIKCSFWRVGRSFWSCVLLSPLFHRLVMQAARLGAYLHANGSLIWKRPLIYRSKVKFYGTLAGANTNYEIWQLSIFKESVSFMVKCRGNMFQDGKSSAFIFYRDFNGGFWSKGAEGKYLMI